MTLLQTSIFGPGDSAGSGGGSGDVNGPGSSTDNALVRWDGATGKLVQNSGATLDDNGILVSPSSTTATSGTQTANTIVFTATPASASTATIRNLNYATVFAGSQNLSSPSLGILNLVSTAQSTSSGIVDLVVSGSFTVANSGAGTITDANGIRLVHNNTGGGTFTNYYGVAFLDSATHATNQWAFKVDPNFLDSTATSIKTYANGGTVYIPFYSTAGTPIVVNLNVSNPANVLVTGDNQVYYRVPSNYNGWKITAVAACVSTVAAAGTVTVQIRNAITTNDVLSTAITIDAGEKDSKDATVPAVINGATNTVSTGDQIAIDVDDAGGGDAKGLVVSLTLTAS